MRSMPRQVASPAPPRVLIDIVRDGRLAARSASATAAPAPPPQCSDQLFHSFVTTKPDGFGLGLFVAQQIAERHRGRLRWQREGEMTSFVFEFPWLEIAVKATERENEDKNAKCPRDTNRHNPLLRRTVNWDAEC